MHQTHIYETSGGWVLRTIGPLSLHGSSVGADLFLRTPAALRTLQPGSGRLQVQEPFQFCRAFFLNSLANCHRLPPSRVEGCCAEPV